MIPLRTKNPPEVFPFVTVFLIVVNIVVFMATASGLHISDSALAGGGFSPAQHSMPRLLSSMFLHANLLHLFGNMLFLWIFGSAVEGRVKWYRFIPLYLASGAAAAFAQMVFIASVGREIPMIGASGAIMGTLGMSMVLFPYAPVTFFSLRLVRLLNGDGVTFDWPMWGAGLYYIGFDILGAAISSLAPGGGVAHMAHLGGALFGATAVFLLKIPRDSESVSQAKESLHAGLDYNALLAYQLEEMAGHQPANTSLTLAWVSRSLIERGHAPTQAIERFQSQFLAIAQGPNPQNIASTTLLILNQYPTLLRPAAICSLASRCEREGFPAPAMQLYDWVLRCPMKTATDDETALFQLALINERWMRNYDMANHLYVALLNRYPMSPLAHSAKANMAVIQRQLQVAPGSPGFSQPQ